MDGRGPCGEGKEKIIIIEVYLLIDLMREWCKRKRCLESLDSSLFRERDSKT